MSKREQILDTALSLFMEKGFDKTSISEILDACGIARGTLYYHFISKEAIMDAIIERSGAAILAKVEEVLKGKALSSYDKLFLMFRGLNMRSLTGGAQMVDYLNRPQNALFHEKSNRLVVEKIGPLLTGIIRQGTTEGVFDTPYPEDCAEMILILAIGFLDQREGGGEEGAQARMGSLFHAVERMLGAEEGSFLRYQERMESRAPQSKPAQKTPKARPN